MDENEIHQWLIQCFGPIQGEMAFRQIEQLPDQIREQLLSQSADSLPDPSQVQSMIQAFSSGGLGSFSEMEQTVSQGPINIKLAKSLALQQATDHASPLISASDGELLRRTMSAANLWLDTTCTFDPVDGEADALTRAGWVEDTIDAWAQFAAPIAASMNDALSAVIADRLGDSFDGEITGMFAGPVPIPLPQGMNSPSEIMKIFANTSFAMQLGQAAGALSHEVRGSFDQGIKLMSNPAGGLIMQNVSDYAASLDIDVEEVTNFLALREEAYARLYANVPWLMPRFEALIGKYARSIDIDLDAMEEQLRDIEALDPESMSGAVNLSNVGIADSPEQRDALASLENLLALVEGWVDCVVWRAGMAHIPHIEQLREMMRRERAIGGPAEQTFESLLGLQLRPKRMREAAQLWEQLTNEHGVEERDAKWSHPDMLPTFEEPQEQVEQNASASSESIDWDAELSKLLDDTNNSQESQQDPQDPQDSDDSSEQ